MATSTQGRVPHDSFDNFVIDDPHAPAYPYRQLGDAEIRLLRILPGHGPIECTLHQVQLLGDTMFYALSYVWGDANDQTEIFLEGVAFPVTKKLHEALQYLRARDDVDDYIWIDAISLNQKDIEEKSAQIPRMMEIYRAALNVLIWLGPNASSEGAEKMIKKVPLPTTGPVDLLRRTIATSDSMVELLFEKARSLWIDWEMPDDETEVQAVLMDTFGPSYKAVVQAAAELLQRPWFKRVWTIQESVLDVSAVVLAGRHRVNLSDFVELVRILARRNRVLGMAPGFGRIVALGQLTTKCWETGDIMKEPSISKRILDVLTSVKNKEASDPRDMLYGLLGIITHGAMEQFPVDLRPDYSLPFEKIYWAYAAYILTATGDLRLLPDGSRSIHGVPSWVPDFRYASFRRNQLHCKAEVGISEDKHELYVQGIRLGPMCDFVAEWEDPRMYHHGIQTRIHDRIRYVEGRIFKLAAEIRSLHLRETLDEMFWRPGKLFHDGGIEGMRRAYSDLRGHSSRSGPWLSRRGRVQTIDEFGKKFALADELRYSHVLLEDGTIVKLNSTGVDVLTSDIVCLLKGALHASLLRPSEEGDNTFTLLSQCVIVSGAFYKHSLDEDFWTRKNLETFALV